MTDLLQNPLLSLLAVLTGGLLLGRIRVAGLSLGASGVLLTALAAGAFGMVIPSGAGQLGLVIFVYCVGLSGGPGFFRTFRRRGKAFAQLAVLLVLSSAAIVAAGALLLGIPADLAAGVFAGAMTSTPGLASALEALGGTGHAAVGYGLAYPFGIVGAVLFAQMLPRVLGLDLAALGARAEDDGNRIERELVEVMNESVRGRRVSAIDAVTEENCQISRYLLDGRLRPVEPDFVLEPGQQVLVVGRKRRLERVIDFLGRKSERTDYVLDAERERMQVVVGSREVVGKTLRELRLLSGFGVTISRILRHGVEIVPGPSDEIEYADALTAVGDREDLKRFASFAGHRVRIFDDTDLISVGVGMVAGVLLGMVTVGLGGAQLSLGLAGGPLLVGLLLGHFGHIGPIKGHLPRAARKLLEEVGLIFFLAAAGTAAGSGLGEAMSEFGPRLMALAAVTAAAPLGLGYFLGRRLFGLDPLETLGAVCGGITSTPGLGAITSATDSQVPVASYAAAYPAALILMTVVARGLVNLLGG